MSTGRIGLQFSVNSFPISSDIDVRINVREDFNFLRYGSAFGLENIGVSFLSSEPINVRDNLIIKDLTGSVPENSPLIFNETTFNSQTFSLPNAKFLITDVFKTRSDGTIVPLYFRHDLTENTSISEVQILDGNFDVVNADEFFYVDEEASLGRPQKSLYTNLRSTFDIVKNEYTIYYVKFRDDTDGSFVTNLLNPKPFYSPVTFDTDTSTRAFSVAASGGQADVTIFFDSKTHSPTPLPGSQRFSIKIDGDNRITVLPPADLPPTEKWYLRINPGEFFRNTVAGDARHYVPEYDNQLFSPVRPFKLLVEKQASVLSSRLLFLDPKPIANLNIAGFYISIIIKDRFGRTTRALTNDPDASIYITPDGVTTDVFFEKGAIQSVSEQDGFVRLGVDIPVDARVFVTYRYTEDFYTYRDISVNSTINPSILNNKITLYNTPEFGTEIDKTIYHLLSDENDLILQASETTDFITVEGVSTGGTINTLIDTNLSSTDIYTGFELEILSGQNAGRKLQISSYNTGLKELTVAEDFVTLLVAGIRYRINKKLNDYSFEDPVTLTVFNYDGWIDTYLDDPHHYILLADTFAIQTLAPQNIATSDIRIRGGGVKDDEVDQSLKLQDQVQWYWDVGFWDGQPYPGMGANLVELPRSILKEVGGSFTRDQVRDIVERHMAEGGYPIIRYYDKSTEIIDVVPGNQNILLTWLDVEAGAYNVYVGENPDQLTLYRTVAGVITSLEIEDLENDKVYYMMVESVVGGIPQLPSRIAFAIPFDPVTSKPGATYGVTIYSEGTYSSG